jgi:hypothetical protein
MSFAFKSKAGRKRQHLLWKRRRSDGGSSLPPVELRQAPLSADIEKLGVRGRR